MVESFKPCSGSSPPLYSEDANNTKGSDTTAVAGVVISRAGDESLTRFIGDYTRVYTATSVSAAIPTTQYHTVWNICEFRSTHRLIAPHPPPWTPNNNTNLIWCNTS
ncbi:unnamed protein product, partial [Sphacelaria rigidula]